MRRMGLVKFFLIFRLATKGSSYSFYSKTALIRLTPEPEDCSFLILNFPSSDVFATWGPAQISFEKSPIL